MTAVTATCPSGTGTDGDRPVLMKGPSWQLVVLDGELDMASGPLVAATLIACAGPTAHRAGVVVDLAQVDFCDSEGLAALVFARGIFRGAGRDVVLRNPSATITAMIDLFYATADLVEQPGDRRACRLAC